MAVKFTTSYIEDALNMLRQFKQMAETAMGQVSDSQLFEAIDEESNSIAIIVKHMAGNMRSRWTDFLTTDGEKADRNRDSEFESPARSRAELMDVWNGGWKLVFQAIEPLQDSDLARTVTIRDEPHSVMQAIQRQLTHYAAHIGQIVFLAKHFRGREWKTLSIPKKR